MIVMNRPQTEYDYEFEVVTSSTFNEDGEKVYEHHGYFEDGFKAFALAEKINGLVIHNVRIALKERKKDNVEM